MNLTRNLTVCAALAAMIVGVIVNSGTASEAAAAKCKKGYAEQTWVKGTNPSGSGRHIKGCAPKVRDSQAIAAAETYAAETMEPGFTDTTNDPPTTYPPEELVQLSPCGKDEGLGGKATTSAATS